jgi:hypothetical protein
MKKLKLLILSIGFTLSAFAQNKNITKDCQQLVLNTLKCIEANPLYLPETDTLNLHFRVALLNRNFTIPSKKHHQEIENQFTRIYNNSTSEYDDSPDYRRYKIRRAMCFATIALLTEPDKAITFIEYSKVSLIGSIENPDDEFLENQFIGILALEIMLKIEANRLIYDDIDKLGNYLNLKKDAIGDKNYQQVQTLINNLRQNLMQQP